MVCGVVVLLAAGGIVVERMPRSDDQASAGTLASLTPSPTPTPTESPTPTAQSTTPSTPRTTPTVGTLASENRVVTRNPLYSAGKLPASHCKEPASRPTTLAKVRKYYTDFVKCLDKVWAPVVRKAVFTFWAPRLEVFTIPAAASPTRPRTATPVSSR